MQISNPIWSALKRADKRLENGIKSRAAFFRDQRKKKAFATSYHKYRLYVNREPTEEVRVMLGEEGKIRNKNFKKHYIEEVSKEVDAGVPFGQTKTPWHYWVAEVREVEPPNESDCKTINEQSLVLPGWDAVSPSPDEGRKEHEGHGLEGCPQDGTLPISDQCDSNSGQAVFDFVAD